MTPTSDASRRPSREAVYQELEKRLIGKTGQLVVVAYVDKIDGKGYFRFGRLESDELIYEEPAGFLTEVRLPISEFFTYPQGSWKVLPGLNGPTYEGDIFGKHEGIAHNPPPLDEYVYFGRPQLELYVGEEEAKKYFKTVEGVEYPSDDWLDSLIKYGPDSRFLADAHPAPPSEDIEAMPSVKDP